MNGSQSIDRIPLCREFGQYSARILASQKRSSLAAGDAVDKHVDFSIQPDSDGLLQYLRSRFILHESAAACCNHLRLSVHQASDHPPLAIPEIRLPKALENISYAHACRQLDFFVSIDKRQAKPRSEPPRSEEHTSELQSLMRNSYAVFCLK